MSKRISRLIAGVATMAAAVVGVQVVGSVSAYAHDNAVTGAVACQADGTYTVTWTVKNDYNDTETVTATSHTPSASSLAPSTAKVDRNGSGQLVQSGISGSDTSAGLTVQGVWDADSFTKPNSGSVTLDGTCRPSKTPAVPTAKDGQCVDRAQVDPSITVPSDSGISYALDGSPATSGTHTVSAGSHTVQASSSTFSLLAPTSFHFDVAAAPADCNDTVVPEQPTVTQSVCINGAPSAPALALPTTDGITYSVSTSAPYAGGQTVVVSAVAESGHEFTAAAGAGWVRVDSTHETFQVIFAARATCAATVGTPTVTQSRCLASGSPTAPTLGLPETAGVTYRTDSDAPLRGGQTVTVTATAGPDFTFSTAPAGWTLVDPKHETYVVTFDTAPTCAAPQSPTLTQATCLASGSTSTVPTLTLPASDSITYSAGSEAPYAAGQSVTVTATAGSGVEFYTDAPQGWTYVDPKHESRTVTFDAAPLCVEPTAPTFNDDRCVDFAPTGATYVVPATTGVDYFVDGTLTAAGTYPAVDGSSVHIVAEPRDGYTLTGTTTFEHDFVPTPVCTTAVVPTDPTFTDAHCSGAMATTSSYLVPTSEGVDYVVDGVTRPAATYVADDGSTVRIVAQPQPGYTLTGTTTFEHTFPAAMQCPSTVVPAAAVFVDDACGPNGPTGASVEIPSTHGVTYELDGASVKAGTYAAVDGRTVTVLASAAAGFTLTGVSQWTHTFPAAPTLCSGIDAGHAGPVTTGATGGSTNHSTGTTGTTTGSTAYTGVPTDRLVAIGIALLLLGGACFAAAGMRRSDAA